MNDIRDLSERLQKLEKRHRRTQALLLVAVIAAASLTVMGQAPANAPIITPRQLKPDAPGPNPAPVDGKVRAEGFVLVDARGAERASLVTDGSGSVFLVLFDANGKARADMQVNNYGPSVNFYDPNAKTRLVLGSTPLVASHVANKGLMEKNAPSSIVLFDAGGAVISRTP